MPKTKEELAEYNRAYYRERVHHPGNHEKITIHQWRKHGHFIPEGTEHAAYTRFSETTHCEFCGWELVTGGTQKSNTKVRHHDHDIEGEDNFIAVICNVCNMREKCTNTSGEPNIFYHKARGKWRFAIRYCGEMYDKYGFKTFEDALTYKGAWYALNSPNAFHDAAWEMVLP